MYLGIGLSIVGRYAAGGGDTTDPVVSDVSYDTGTDTLTLTVDEPVTLYALHNASATPLDAATIEAGAEVTQALAAGIGYVDWDDSAWGAGTWYLHVVVKDAAGNSTVLTPIEHIIAAPGFVETWSDYANGNTFTELDAAYARNSTGFTTNVLTDAGGPDGLGVDLITDTNIVRRMDRDDITAALAARTTERVNILAKVRFASLANSRAGIGFSSASAVFVGAAIWRAGSGWSVGCMLAGDPFNLTNKTDTSVTSQADSGLFWVRIEVDGLDAKVRAWADGGSEPGTWTTRTAGAAIAFSRLDLVTARLGGPNLRVLGYSVGIDADAPSF